MEMKLAVMPVIVLVVILLAAVAYGLHRVRSRSARPAARPPLLQFRLRTLLLAMAIVGAVLALWRQQVEVRCLRSVVEAHGLAGEDTEMASQSWRATVEDVITDTDFAVRMVKLETLGPAQITVTDGQGDLSQLWTGPRSPASSRSISRLTIVAELSEGSDPKQNTLRQHLQISQSPGGSVGGPGLLSVPSDRRFDDLFALLLEPGVYQRGARVEVCRFGDRTWTITVK